MTKEQKKHADLLQGTLDMLILRTLLYGPAHGRHIGKHIQRTTDDYLQMQHGSLYPALQRLVQKGWIDSEWRTTENNRRAKYYRLTTAGRRAATDEAAIWRRYVAAVDLILHMA